ncbi:MAG: nucleotidyl transferase AbiEii/AbiGii toxin family protein [Flavisolibacter sp.]|nr:nucleotidyl transferase AbiEii/AbiGii toxin family protein [Flavisolibacter sp.]MBD0293899.1 nucleotidyl transferase AbiEii/AbiGii toxin family protein [Flavisolibacter sp.]MBD0375910.1 nucleotidyl transferase AbiEii/AbiGii toxin family protein [Flavisolibacter sp.]
MDIPALHIFRLAGGTSLALQKGHRISIDIDLFAGQPFDNTMVLQALEAYLYPEKPAAVRTFPFGFFCTIQDIKTDFIFWGDSFIEEPVVEENIRMASPLEIFAMKLQAVISRKTKKDFFDIALLLQSIPLKNALEAYKKKYNEQDIAPVLKQLLYFEEADGDVDPNMLISFTWQEVKQIIMDAVQNFWKEEL